MKLENSLLQKALLQLHIESNHLHVVMRLPDFESIILQLVNLTSQSPFFSVVSVSGEKALIFKENLELAGL